MKEALKHRFEVIYAGDGTDLDVPTALEIYKPAIYVQPGGGDDMGVAWKAVSPVKHAILEYVKNGGRYIGICMGSFLSSKGGDEDDFEGYKLITKSGWDAANYIETEGADVTDMDQTLVHVTWKGHKKAIFFQGGPSFKPIRHKTEGEVIAHYSNGDAAAIVVPYGDGKVGVTGPHPEATASWYDDVVNEGGPRGHVVHSLFMDLVDTTLSDD